MAEQRHEHSTADSAANRFRGEMDRDRTDGGFLPVDRGSYTVSTHPTTTDGGENFARDRADDGARNARWPDENAGENAGAHAGRTRRVAERHGGGIGGVESPTSVRGAGNDTLK